MLFSAIAQNPNYKSFETHLGDTINRIDENDNKQGRWIYYGKDKRGWTHRLFNSKQIVEEGFYFNNKKNKLWKSYHYTNKLKSEITYVDDKPNGIARFFNTDGKITLEGQMVASEFVSDYYLYDVKGNKIKRSPNAEQKNGYLDFKGYVQKTLGKPVENVTITIERNDIEIKQLTSNSNGSFECKLDLNFEYTLHFNKKGFTSQSLLINAYTDNIYDSTIYKVNDWKVTLYDNFASVATTEVFGFLLNKPSDKIYYNKRKKSFNADGSYVNLFKKEVNGISETTKLMLVKAAEENKKLEIENLRIEAEKKEKEIELLTKAQLLKEAELKNREVLILAEKAEAEKKTLELQSEAEIHKQEKLIRELELFQKQEKIQMQELQATHQTKEFERLALARKLQELELKQKQNQLNQTTDELGVEQQKSLQAQHELNMATREKAIQEKELKQNLLYLYVMLGIVVVVGVFSFFLYRNIQQKKKANLLLARQSKEISDKSKIIELKKIETEQSIQYAQRIQYAILPPHSEINQYLNNYFILYKPKDIVSGDFYFFSDYHYKLNKDNVVIAAVDCTGHGVPGAFMSMVGNEKLKDAVDVSSSPGKILNELNKGIKAALRQEENSTRDGMDLSLCSIPAQKNTTTNTTTIKYAGANRPLWIIRNDSKEIEEVRATKFSIGGHTLTTQEFVEHEIVLNTNDTIYLHSDGFADQFGGASKKKLMTKKFKELLVSIQDKSMQQQHDYLNSFIDNWRADVEQIDDILVIGIKF